MTRTIRTDRIETGNGARTREFARIDRESAPEITDPKVLAMTRTRPAGEGDRLSRFARIERSESR